MFRIMTSSWTQWINFVYKNCRWRMKSCHFKKKSHEFFRITTILWSKCRRWNIKESCVAFRCDSFCEHSFTSTRRTNCTIWKICQWNVGMSSKKLFIPNKTPFHGLRIPLKKSGIIIGNTTASCKIALASANPAISLHRIFGFFCKISFSIVSTRPSSYPIVLKLLCFPPLNFFIGDFLSFGDVELFVLEFSSSEFSWSSEFPSSDDDFFCSFWIFDDESFRNARILSTDLDFRKADFNSDDDDRSFLASPETPEYELILFTELEWLLIDGSVGWSSGSCLRNELRQRLSCVLVGRTTGGTSSDENVWDKNWKR